jgi:SAM-dependent methyltransferase
VKNQTVSIQTEARPFCPLCGERGEMFYSRLKDQLFGAPGEWDLCKCPAGNCGLLWLNPAPVQEDIGKAYQSYYTHGGTGESLMRKCVKTAYTLLSRLPEWTVGLAQARNRMRWLYLDNLFSGKLLDVGCGDGLYLHFMAGKGWKTEGLDFDANALKRARETYGLNVHQSDLFSRHYPAHTFDAVTLRHVIEHLPDPLGVLRECLRILRPGGTLVIVTPNSESLGHGLTHECWRGLEVPRHLQIFSLTSLKLCAGLLGYKPGHFQAFTTATGADFILDESLALQSRGRSDLPHGEQKKTLHWTRTLRAIRLQYREHLSLEKDPSIGEEAVLILNKK